MENMVSVPAAKLQQFVDFIEKAGAMLEEVAKDSTIAKQAAPKTVDLLIRQGLLDSSQKSAAVEALSSSHAKVMDALRKTASHVGLPSMGAPDVMDKSAKAPRSALEEADRRFEETLGVR